MGASIVLRAPAGVSAVALPDGSLAKADPSGNVVVDSAFRAALEAGGFADVPIETEKLSWASGQFYGPLGETLAAILTVANTVYAHPIYIPNPVTLASICCNVTTGQAGGKARMGIYGSVRGRPSSLIAAAPEVTGLTGAAAGTGTFSGGLALNQGWYWLAGVFGATSTMPSVAGVSQALSSHIAQLLGHAAAANALAVATTALVTGMNGSFTYGALPQVLPALSLVTTAACPAFALGVS